MNKKENRTKRMKIEQNETEWDRSANESKKKQRRKSVINEKETRIYFNKTESFDMKSAVATHYYERYLDFKKREKEINPWFISP